MFKDLVTIIIRSAGERTKKVCYDIVAQQVEASCIHVIEERPFSKAVEKTFQIGIDSKRPWTLAIDADLFLAPDAVSVMIKNAEKLPENLYTYQGLIFDYLFGDLRSGGPHLYKTKHLPIALEALRNNPNGMRPESETYGALAKLGYMTYSDDICFALHDFEQFKKDYYRKGFFHGKKALSPQLDHLFSFWKKDVKLNTDFKIALVGLIDGLLDTSRRPPDISSLNDKYQKSLKFEDLDKTETCLELGEAESIISKIWEIFQTKKTNGKLAKIHPFYFDDKGKTTLKTHTFVVKISEKFVRLFIRISRKMNNI